MKVKINQTNDCELVKEYLYPVVIVWTLKNRE